MAYKFQLGKAKLSGSVETTQGITSQGGLLVNGDVDLDAGVINTAELADLSVTVDKLGAEAVETAKIKALNVTAAKLAVDAVETAKIKDGAVTNDKLAGSIASSKIADLSTFDTADIAEGTNLYHTVTRVRNAVGADGAGINYDSGSGVFSLELTGGSLQADASGLRTNITLTTLAPSGSGGLLYNNADGKLDFKPVEESWVRGRLSGKDAVKYNSVSGSISLQTTGSSLFQNADGLQVQQSWVRDQFSNGAGLDYSAGVFSVGSGDITNGMLANSSLSVVAGNGLIDGGSVSLGGSVTLNVSASSANAIVVSADGIDLKDTINGDRTFTGLVTINKLNVTGTLTTVNTENLEIRDARILMASGSTAWAADVGFDFGSHVGHATLLTADVDMGGVGGVDSLSSSLPLVAPAVKATSFYGNLVGSMQLNVVPKAVSYSILSGDNVIKATANITLTLPTGPAVGQEHRVKCFVADDASPAPAVIVAAQAGGATIEGLSQVVLESYGAAVSLVWDGTMWMVF